MVYQRKLFHCCIKCHKLYKDKESLRKHKRKCRITVDRQLTPCPYCENYFETKKKMDRHTESCYADNRAVKFDNIIEIKRENGYDTEETLSCDEDIIITTPPAKTEVVLISSESETEEETKENKIKIDAELQAALDELFGPDTPTNTPGSTPVQDERTQSNKKSEEYMKRKIVTYEDVPATKIVKCKSYIDQMDLSDISDCESEGDNVVVTATGWR
jgi:hypothetical protein